jgi:hypothetical protein
MIRRPNGLAKPDPRCAHFLVGDGGAFCANGQQLSQCPCVHYRELLDSVPDFAHDLRITIANHRYRCSRTSMIASLGEAIGQLKSDYLEVVRLTPSPRSPAARGSAWQSGTSAVTSASHAELAELYQRADRAIEEAHKLHEDYCFIVSWLHTRPAPNARYTWLLHENRNDVQHFASLLNDATGCPVPAPSDARTR